MSTLLDVVLPVFLVLGFGYLAAWKLGLTEGAVDGAMVYAQGFAFPVLLFRGVSGLHLSETFNPAMLGSFYTGVLVGFFAGFLGAHYLFKRPWQDSVAVGFATAFSNGGLLGLPITERAYGSDAISFNFAIIAFHAPFVYTLAVTVMEIVKAEGRSIWATALSVLRSMAKNPLLIGIVLGALTNLSGLALPGPAKSAVDMIAASAIPVALVGLGGILYRYKPEGDLKLVAWMVAISLVLHPAIVFGLAHLTHLSIGPMRSAVLMAAMPTGVNAYVFANMYGVARRVAATAVLASTAVSILSIWLWLGVLG